MVNGNIFGIYIPGQSEKLIVGLSNERKNARIFLVRKRAENESE